MLHMIRVTLVKFWKPSVNIEYYIHTSTKLSNTKHIENNFLYFKVFNT